jgi:type III restriction enzyme
MGYYQDLLVDKTYQEYLKKTEQPFIKLLENDLAFDFRYYQKQALAILDIFWNAPEDYYPPKKDAIEEVDGHNIPFYCFEMATGSGKTLLMAANVLYLLNKGIKDIFIIVKGKTIYDKTIREFDINNKKSIFNKAMDYKYNLITGENYQNRSSNYDENADFNLFVFNIEKFFEKSGQTGGKTMRVTKPWEESVWRDAQGYTISLVDFLKQKKIAIITDEAHHYQNKTSNDIIKLFYPEVVLEYTATAQVTDTKKKIQKRVYVYPVKQYIKDGYGKKIRAYGFDPIQGTIEVQDQVNDTDKERLILGILTHLVKKKALNEQLKPILLLKCRSINHSNELFKYISEEMVLDDDFVRSAYERIIQDDEYNLITLIKDHVSIQELLDFVEDISEKTFVIHSENRNTKEILDKFDNIETNSQEIVVQVDVATEGWNIDNVYTILILTNNQGNVKTYVKQLIGRGLRLYKGVRTLDDSTNLLENEEEILHVVCAKGNNFGKFVEEIEKELDAEIESEPKLKTEKNLLGEFVTIDKYNNLFLPTNRIENDISDDFLNRINFNDLEIQKFLDDREHPKFGKPFIDVMESATGEERDLETKKEVRVHKTRYSDKELILRESDIEKMINDIIAEQHVLPSSPDVKKKLKDVIFQINNKHLMFKEKYEEDYEFFSRRFLGLLKRHLYKKIENYFEPINEEDTIAIKQVFQEYEINLKQNVETSIIENVITKEKSLRLLEEDKKGIKTLEMTGFIKAWHKYNWFESSHELKMAHILDVMDNVEFWIRNRRDYWLEHHVGNKYYPDFIVKLKESKGLYIIEVKGEIYIEQSKYNIEVLFRLKESGNKCIFLTDKTIDKFLWDSANEKGYHDNFQKNIDRDELEKTYNDLFPSDE